MSGAVLTDPALPGLALALGDAGELSAALGRLLVRETGERLETADLVRVRHRPGKRAVIQLALGLVTPGRGRVDRPGALWLFAGDKAARTASRHRDEGGGPTMLYEPATGGLLTRFPYDRRVPAIAGFLSNTARHAADLLGDIPVEAPRLVRYRPGLGATFRWRGRTRTVYVKIHGDTDPLRAADRLGALQGACRGSGIEIVPAHGTAPSIGALSLREAPGVPLDRLIATGRLHEISEAAGRTADAVVRFGRIETSLGRHRVMDGGGFLGLARRSADLLARLDPELGRDARHLVAHLENRRGRLTRGLCHLDIKPEHVFAAPDGVHAVDLDSVGIADPLYDLAMLDIRIRHLAETGRCAPAQADAAIRNIRPRVRTDAAARYTWLRSIAALQVARHEAQHLRAGWQRRARAILFEPTVPGP